MEWSLAQRVAFRFACLYLVLVIFPFPTGLLPGTGWLGRGYNAGWHVIVPWVGKHVLHLDTDITVFTNGSGDTTYNYVQVLCFLVLAAVGAALWSVLDRRRTRYARLHDLLRIYVRYHLAATMLNYGLAKLFKLQFPFPSPERLMAPFGQASPMGLLWSFMGYSTGYNIFTGGAEVLGGLLLLFRRTTTLGALVLVGVMANVVALNFFYDVPVKIFSSHLLLMAGFLVLPQLRQLVNLLVLNRPTEPVVLWTPFQRRWLERGSLGVRLLFSGWMVYSLTSSVWELRGEHGDDSPKPALFGIYEVESFTHNGAALPLVAGDATGWRNLMVSRRDRLTIRFLNDVAKRFTVEDDPEKKTLTLSGSGAFPGEEDDEKCVLTYARPDPEHLVVDGPFRGATIHVVLKKVDESQFLLLNRGFHWTQEYPFNH